MTETFLRRFVTVQHNGLVPNYLLLASGFSTEEIKKHSKISVEILNTFVDSHKLVRGRKRNYTDSIVQSNVTGPEGHRGTFFQSSSFAFREKKPSVALQTMENTGHGRAAKERATAGLLLG